MNLIRKKLTTIQGFRLKAEQSGIKTVSRVSYRGTPTMCGNFGHFLSRIKIWTSEHVGKLQRTENYHSKDSSWTLLSSYHTYSVQKWDVKFCVRFHQAIYVEFISVVRIFWVPWKVQNKFIMKWKRWSFSYYLFYAHILPIFNQIKNIRSTTHCRS